MRRPDDHFLKLPKHIAIIMDGNGRWATARRLPRTQGHVEGVKRVEETIIESARLGIGYLTFYTFSTENWTRPKSEVSMLMKTLVSVIKRKINVLNDNNVRFQTIGIKEGMPTTVLNALEDGKELTKNNSGLTVNIAVNYGSRQEILDATKSLIRQVQDKTLNIEDITEDVFSQELYTKGMPDPDFLIRTSGEQRISNYLLWQLSYAEFYFTKKCWPEFNKKELYNALRNFEQRDRRFGNVKSKAKIAVN